VDKDGPNVRHQHSNEDAEYRRVELITGRKQRRDWTSDEKAKILEASAAPGATVAEVARRYQVSRGLLWTWRRKAMDDLEAETTPHFVPLRIDLDGVGGIVSAVSEEVQLQPVQDKKLGLIEVEIGTSRIRVEGLVDPEVLRQMLGLIRPAR